MNPIKTGFIVFLLLEIFAITPEANGWIYPEHRRIHLRAIQKMDATHRTALNWIWAEARRGREGRMTEGVIDPEQGRKPRQLDYAAWSAISGDHSCSPADLIEVVLKSDWILKVADIASRLQTDISKAKKRSKHINAIRNSDIRFQRADPEYATRAGSNNVHFLLARKDAEIETAEYFISCLTSGVEINALSAYSWFHLSALKKAKRYVTGNLSYQEKSDILLAALADEAFALHFLEDVYAAGHVAGTWGAASVRKGTHDYYNEYGLEIVTWNGQRRIANGDAFMTPADSEFASGAVQLSLEQVIDTAAGVPNVTIEVTDMISIKPDTFNVCKNNFVIPMKLDTVNLKPILLKVPVPGLATGVGELPRFRSELGMFVGISTGMHGSAISGGFAENQTSPGFVGGLDANVRLGLGLDGVLNQAGDGLVFLQAGIRQDASSSNQFANKDGGVPAGAQTSAIPGRTAYNFRLRMPFWLVPGDLVLAAPILLLVSPGLLSKMAVTASNGGVIPWQSGIATPIGRFQFVLGREVGISFYGSSTPRQDAILVNVPSATSAGNNILVQYSSTKIDFPILEYVPFRSFSLNQSSSLLIQFSVGLDIPRDATVIAPLPITEPAPVLKNIWYFGARIVFDWRRYF